jgi:glutathione S-transferase
MAITFYYAPQSSASRVHWTLEELGLPYEKIKLDFAAGDTRKPEFLALNPNGKVPTLVIDGTAMFESVAIQIALGERYGVAKGLWPELGSAEHLQALAWIVWGQVTLTGALIRYSQSTSSSAPTETHDARQAETMMAGIRTCFGILEDRLSSRPYLLGERFTLVDLDIAAVLGWALGMLKLDISTYPHLAAWVGRSNDRPGMRAAMAG